MKDRIFCFVDRASLYNLFQMQPTRCTILLSIFISTSLHVSGNYVPISRETYCIYATLANCYSVWVAVWSAGWDETHPNHQTRRPSTQGEKYQCRIRGIHTGLYDICHCCVYSEKIPDDGQRNCPKHVEFYSKNKFEKLVQS